MGKVYGIGFGDESQVIPKHKQWKKKNKLDYIKIKSCAKDIISEKAIYRMRKNIH